MAATTTTDANIREAYAFFGQNDVAKTHGIISERVDLSTAKELDAPAGYVIGAILVKSGTLTYDAGCVAKFGAVPSDADTLAVDSWDLYKLTKLKTKAGSAGDYCLIFFE
jgi:hypothetical protein